MKQIYFEKGECLVIDGVRHTIEKTFSDPNHPNDYEKRVVSLEDDRGYIKQLRISELLRLIASRSIMVDGADHYSDPEKGDDLIQHRALATVSDKNMIKAIRRKDYVVAILAHGEWNSNPSKLQPLIKEIAISLGDMNRPSASTVNRWYKLFLINKNDISCLIDRNDRKGNRKPRIDAKVIGLCEKIIDRHYLKAQRLSVIEIHDIIRHEINVINKASPDNKLKLPSRSTIYNLVNAIPKFELVAKRKGKYFAINSFTNGKEAPQPKFVLEIAEIDHSPIDILVIDDRTKKILGNPVITILLDAYSRMPLGMYVGICSANIQSVSGCLEHAIMPKDYVKEKYPGIKGEWPTWGKPMSVVSDNGGEFHSKELEAICMHLGSMPQFCPKRIPFFKGKIERYLKTLNYTLIHTLPGTTFANYLELADYKPEKSATISFQTLIEILHIWIIDIYSVDNHEGIDDTPLNKWREGINKMPPAFPANVSRLKQLLSRLMKRKISSDGFVLEKILYNSDEAQQLRYKFGNSYKFTLRYREDDLTRIWIHHPETHEMIEVPAVDQEYTTGINIYQHKMVLHLKQNARRDRVDRDEIADSKNTIREKIEADRISNSKVRRKHAAKALGVSSGSEIVSHKDTKKTSTIKVPIAGRLFGGLENVEPPELQTTQRAEI